MCGKVVVMRIGVLYLVIVLVVVTLLFPHCHKKPTYPNERKEWEVVESPTTNSLNAVYFLTEDDGWAVGANGTILHYDGGEWSVVESPTTEYLVDVHFVSPDDGWAISETGIVLHYSSSSWGIDTNLAGRPEDIFFLTSTSGWIASAGWCRTSSGKQGDAIFQYDGSSWHDISPGAWNIYSIHFVSENNGWAAGFSAGQGNDFFAHYDGASWDTTTYCPIPDGHIYSFSFLSPDNGWAVGRAATILHYDGSQWAISEEPSCYDLYSIFFVAPDEGWAVGSMEFGNGVILHYDNTGWNIVSIPEVRDLNSVSFTSGENGWTVGRDGTILRYRPED